MGWSPRVCIGCVPTCCAVGAGRTSLLPGMTHIVYIYIPRAPSNEIQYWDLPHITISGGDDEFDEFLGSFEMSGLFRIKLKNNGCISMRFFVKKQEIPVIGKLWICGSVDPPRAWRQ